LAASDVVDVAAMEIAARQLVLVQPDEHAFADGLVEQFVPLRRRAVENANAVRLAQPGHLVDPRSRVAGRNALEKVAIHHIDRGGLDHGFSLIFSIPANKLDRRGATHSRTQALPGSALYARLCLAYEYN